MRITNTAATSSMLIVDATTFDLGANRNEPVSGVVLANGGLILGTGTSSVINTGDFDVRSGNVTAILAGTGSNLNKTTSGTVILSGVNTYTGNTTVTAGTLRNGISNAIAPASNLTVNGTTAVYDLGANQSDTVNGVSLDGNGSITGTGNSTLTSTGGFQVMNGTVTAILAGNGTALSKTTNGTVMLSGVNTYTGNTTVTAGTLSAGVNNAIAPASNLTVNGTAAKFDLGLNHTDTVNVVTLDGNGSITGTGNSTLTSTGGFQVMNGTVTAILAGSGAGLNKTTNGTVTLAGANTYTGATNVTAGTLVIGATGSVANTSTVQCGDSWGATYTVDQNGTIAVLNTSGTINGNSTLTAGTYNLGNSTLINTPLGNGTLISNGNVTINSTLGSSNITVQSGTMTLTQPNLLNPNGTVVVSTGAILTLGGGNNTVLSLTGNGTLSQASGVLTVTNGLGGFNGVVTGGLSTNGTLTSSGNLNLPSGTVSSYPNGTTITGGTLAVNGILITPLVTVNAGGTLGGNGTVTGNVVDNGGTVSPGNSPGIITIGGNYTEGGTLKAEIAGTSGPGSPTGNDQVVVGGNTTIIPATSTLHLVKDLGFEPAKGDTFKIISGAPGSISGHFGTFNSDFTNDLIFVVDTGQVIATGLVAGTTGTNVLNAFPGTNANQRAAMISGLQVGDHQYGGGDLLALLLNPANAAQSAQILNQGSPEAYAGLSDYASRVTQAYRNTAAGMNPVAQSGNFSLFAGYSHLGMGSDSSQNQADYDLESNGAVVGARVSVGSMVTLGVFTGIDYGTVDSTYLSSSVNGEVSGVFATVDPLPDHRLTILAGLSYGKFKKKGTRQTFSGASSFQSVPMTDYRLDLGARYLAYQQDKFSLTPEIDLSADQSKVGDFTENNATDPLQALHVHGQNNTSIMAGVALNAGYAVTSKVDLTARFGVSQQLDHSYRDVTANVANQPGDFTARAPGLGDTEYTLGVGVNYNVTKAVRLSLGYQAGFATEQKMSNAVFVGVSVSF